MEKPKQIKKRNGAFCGEKEEIKNPNKKGYRKGCFGNTNESETRSEKDSIVCPNIKQGRKRRKIFAFNHNKKVSNNYYINRKKNESTKT